MKFKRVLAVLLIVVMMFVLAGCTQSAKRNFKSLESNWGVGLNRTLTVYDYNGNVLKQYKGKFDVKESESKVLFDMENGKRVIIYNAIVINEED